MTSRSNQPRPPAMDELFGEASECTRSLARLETEAGHSLFVLTEVEGGALRLTLSDGARTWAGRVTNRQVGEMSRRVRMGEEEFLRETLQALSREKMGTKTFVYSSRETSSQQLELVWKKHLIAENIRFQLGSVTLDPEPSDQVHSQLLVFAIGRMVTLQEQIADLQTERGRLVSERQSALSQLERCANLKEDVEGDLFHKFTLVLNDKKAKIRRLMGQLSSVTEQTKALQSQPHTSRSQEKKTPPVEGDAPGRQSGDDTDDELVPSDSAHTPSPQPKAVLPGASLLGEEESVSPPVKRRRRVGGRKTPGKPDIPRPPSIARPPSHEAKVKVVSTSSEERGGRREESLESDELLDLL